MEVIATKPGFHGKLRQVGATFDVQKGSKATWFEPVASSHAAGKPSKDKPDEKLADDQPLV